MRTAIAISSVVAIGIGLQFLESVKPAQSAIGCERVPIDSVETGLNSNATDWLLVGVLLGRAEEAARRDVAPSVVLTYLRDAETTLRHESNPVQDVFRRLIEAVAQTDTPAVVVSAIAQAKSDLIHVRQPKVASDVSVSPRLLAPHWLGTWETTYGTMVLSFVDESGKIAGYYGSSEHTIEGTVDANDPSLFEGMWNEGSSTGRFWFRLVDPSQWVGTWTSGDLDPGNVDPNSTSTSTGVNWTATRIINVNDTQRWTGIWNTSFGQMHLWPSDDKSRLVGYYGSPGKVIQAWVDPSKPNSLVGTWHYTSSTSYGRIHFPLTSQDRFEGTYTYANADPSDAHINWSGDHQLADSDLEPSWEESLDSGGEAVESGSVIGIDRFSHHGLIEDGRRPRYLGEE